jgi:hypothetical protein
MPLKGRPAFLEIPDNRIAVASISPLRNHAEIAPTLEINVGEVRNAVSLIARSYLSLYSSGVFTPKYARYALINSSFDVA